VKRPPLRRLFHLTEASNLEAIRAYGLLSTAALLDRDAPPPELRVQVEGWRSKAVRLPSGVLIGDQWCQPPERLALCLESGLTPQDWYDRLNRFVSCGPASGPRWPTRTPTAGATRGCWSSRRRACWRPTAIERS
jgi:hypothetical protein